MPETKWPKVRVVETRVKQCLKVTTKQVGVILDFRLIDVPHQPFNSEKKQKVTKNPVMLYFYEMLYFPFLAESITFQCHRSFLSVVSQILPEIQRVPRLSVWEELTFEDVFICIFSPSPVISPYFSLWNNWGQSQFANVEDLDRLAALEFVQLNEKSHSFYCLFISPAPEERKWKWSVKAEELKGCVVVGS